MAGNDLVQKLVDRLTARPDGESLVFSHRFRPVELTPWIVAIACFFLFPDYL